MARRFDPSAHRQFSLFDDRPLFEPETLARARTEWAKQGIPNFDDISGAAVEFTTQIEKLLQQRKNPKEEALEQEFNRAFFQRFLGYSLYPGLMDGWTAWPKPPVGMTGLSGTPDIILGQFTAERFEPVAVVELKKPTVNLDAPQISYGGITPVEQAFNYARKLGTCRWVCVCNMAVFRFYSVESNRAYYEFDLLATDRISVLNELWHLVAADNLISPPHDSRTWRLLMTSQSNQVAFQEGFYHIYSEIRADIIDALSRESPETPRPLVVQGAQRLLDRLLFVYFCEDHPDRLLRKNLVKEVVENAVKQPDASRTKAYEQVKALFRDLDVGADTPFWKIPKYNGEIFKEHPLIDHVHLPDDLHGKRYTWNSKDRSLRRSVDGVYGLHIFDFWKELDRDLLGNIFERSIGDLTAIASGGRPDAREAFGIYYTAARLARFAATSVMEAALRDDVRLQAILSGDVGVRQAEETLEAVISHLKNYRVADVACGSGVFLTAAFDSLLAPFRKVAEANSASMIERELSSFRQSELLKSSIFGCDLLPQAVELAKLALWLAAARRNEASADLSSNFIIGDSLHPEFGAAKLAKYAGGSFDVIVGNPPWGAEYDPRPDSEGMDSWEVFLRLCVNLLKPGGRLCLILPDTLFSTEKVQTREWLLKNLEVEKLFALGPDWFTNKVRMGSVMLQGKKTIAHATHSIKTLVLAGDERTKAIKGLRPLAQSEEIGSSTLSQRRISRTPGVPFTVLMGEEELPLIQKIEGASVPLGELVLRARGDEMSAAGLFWRCGNCQTLTVPGAKKKGAGYESKRCPKCGCNLSQRDSEAVQLVNGSKVGAYTHPYVDGDSLSRRYQSPSRKFIRTDLPVLPALKPQALYSGKRC